MSSPKENVVLERSYLRTKFRRSGIMSLRFEFCRLMTSTTAALSVTKQTHLLAMDGPQMTMGKNSRKVIFKELHHSGHEP